MQTTQHLVSSVKNIGISSADLISIIKSLINKTTGLVTCKCISHFYKYPVPVTTGLRFVLLQLSCWDFGFDSHRGHRSLSVASFVCCQVAVCVGLITLPEESDVYGESQCDRRVLVMKG